MLTKLISFRHVERVTARSIIAFRGRDDAVINGLPFRYEERVVRVARVVSSLRNSNGRVTVRVRLRVQAELKGNGHVVRLRLPNMFLVVRERVVGVIRLLLRALAKRDRLTIPRLTSPREGSRPCARLRLMIRILVPRGIFRFQNVLVERLNRVVKRVIAGDRGHVFLLRSVGRLPTVEAMELRKEVTRSGKVEISQTFLQHRVPVKQVNFITTCIRLSSIRQVSHVTRYHVQRWNPVVPGYKFRPIENVVQFGMFGFREDYYERVQARVLKRLRRNVSAVLFLTIVFGFVGDQFVTIAFVV